MSVNKKEIISFLSGTLLGGYGMARLCEAAMKKEERRVNKNNYLFRTSCKWLKVRQEHKGIKDYLDKEDIKEIAVYGVGELGKCLLKELEDTDISVKYIIDKKGYRRFKSYACYSPSDELPEVQTVIITPVSDSEQIAEQLGKKMNARFIALSQIIDELSL